MATKDEVEQLQKEGWEAKEMKGFAKPRTNIQKRALRALKRGAKAKVANRIRKEES